MRSSILAAALLGLASSPVLAEASVEELTIAGPFNSVGVEETPSRKAIFVCQPRGTEDQDACATKIVTNLASKAFRRQPSPGDVEQLMKLYRSEAARSGFEAGIEYALERILIDPGHYEGQSSAHVQAPMPLGRMGQKLAAIQALPPERRPINLYVALAEVAR